MQQMEEPKNKPTESMMDNWSVDWQEVGQKFIRKMKDVSKDKDGV